MEVFVGKHTLFTKYNRFTWKSLFSFPFGVDLIISKMNICFRKHVTKDRKMFQGNKENVVRTKLSNIQEGSMLMTPLTIDKEWGWTQHRSSH